MYRLGIDVGGTNIVAGIVDDNYKILSKAQVKTAVPRSADEIADDMAAVSKKAAAFAGISMDDVSECGMGIPGVIDRENGIIVYSNNLRFNNIPIVKMMKDRLGKDFSVANDADSAAYGEYIAGAGRGTRSFAMITLGTGVGGGFIIDSKIYSGFNGAGGEFGHTVIQMNGEACTCGRNGCFEAYASATALIRQTRQAMLKNPDSIMWKMCGGDILKISGKTAFDAMRAGDAAGQRVVSDYITYLSTGIANIINALQPEVFCIGGGVSKEGATLTEPIERIIYAENFARNIEKRTAIKAAQLGNDAGIIGAAFIGE